MKSFPMLCCEYYVSVWFKNLNYLCRLGRGRLWYLGGSDTSQPRCPFCQPASINQASLVNTQDLLFRLRRRCPPEEWQKCLLLLQCRGQWTLPEAGPWLRKELLLGSVWASLAELEGWCWLLHWSLLWERHLPSFRTGGQLHHSWTQPCLANP